jgi:hypothetical protein
MEDTRRGKKKDSGHKREVRAHMWGWQTREKKVVGERTDTRERKKADTHGHKRSWHATHRKKRRKREAQTREEKKNWHATMSISFKHQHAKKKTQKKETLLFVCVSTSREVSTIKAKPTHTF